MKNENDKTGLPVSPSVTPEGAQGAGQWHPGPWRIEIEIKDGEEDAIHICAGGDDSPEWACILTCVNTDSQTQAEWKRYKASAVLASAAPELYDALADVVKMFRGFPLLHSMNGPKVAAIEALLAKVRGETAPAIQSPTPQPESKKGTQGGQ